MQELLARVLAAVGKTEADFLREVEEMKNDLEATQRLTALQQQQAETSSLLLEFMEYLSTGGGL